MMTKKVHSKKTFMHLVYLNKLKLKKNIYVSSTCNFKYTWLIRLTKCSWEISFRCFKVHAFISICSLKLSLSLKTVLSSLTT